MDECFTWIEITGLVQLALLKHEKRRIYPLERSRGVIFGESWAETCWLDAHGSQKVAPGRVVFHRWTPWLGTVADNNLVQSRWIRVRGFPLHLWIDLCFVEIGEACGGLVDINSKSINEKDFR